MEEAFGNKREFSGLLAWVERVFCLAFGAFVLLSSGFGPLPYMEQRAVFAFFGLTIVLVNSMARKRRPPETKIPWWDLILIGLVIAIVVNLLLNYLRYGQTIWSPTVYEYFLGIAVMLIVLETTRRTIGWTLPGLTLAVFAYVWLAPYLPGVFGAKPIPFANIIMTQSFMEHGVWGSLTGIGATVVGVTVIFGFILLMTGGGVSFTDIALLLAGRIRGGPALVAVVSSAMFGTISGSAIANVTVTGNYTIPMMKRLGYRAEFAAGVESTASTGGGWTPPIMGSVAFIMAELLAVSYWNIAIAAIFPALLFYSALFFSILTEARKRGLSRVPEVEIPTLKSVITWRKLSPLIIPIGIFMWLIWEGWSIYRSCFWAIVVGLFLYFFASSADFSWRATKQRLKTVWNAIESGSRGLAALASLLMCASLLVGVMNYSGLAVKVSAVLGVLAGEYLLLALIIGAFVCIILGLGLPAVPSYIITVSVIGVPLIKMGIDPLAMHMFVFIYACLAHITPPTCEVCYVAAAIAKTNWLRVSLEACRLGMVAFILPFTFIFNPVYLMKGEPTDIVIAGVLGVVGTFFLACGAFGYLRSTVNIPSRLLFLGGGFSLLLPWVKAYTVAGLFVAAGILIMIVHQLIKRRIGGERRKGSPIG